MTAPLPTFSGHSLRHQKAGEKNRRCLLAGFFVAFITAMLYYTFNLSSSSFHDITDIQLLKASSIQKGVVTEALESIQKQGNFDRFAWNKVITHAQLQRGAEVGVWKGAFAENMLTKATGLTEYILVDPWEHLEDWNKPFNVKQREFDAVYQEAMKRTKNGPHGNKVTVLRGKSHVQAAQVPDESLDFVYIDGDHTLKGIVIDLVTWYPKVKIGGLVSGDDFDQEDCNAQDGVDPTMVKPVVKAFAEAMGATIVDMGSRQYGFEKMAPLSVN